ncbi:MAG: N-acetyltransferase [Planctomycetota bacterium]
MANFVLKQSPCRPWHEFIMFPWTSRVYKDYPNWVPPLISEDKKLFNPSIYPFHQNAEVNLFLLYDNNKPVARVAAIINHNHNRFHNEKTGFFGFFECADSPEAAQYILDAAAKFCRERGMERIRGPMNFSTNDTCGLLIEGFDSPPVIMMPYNPPYYINLLEKSEFAKAKDLYAYFADKSIEEKVPRLERLAGRVLADPAVKMRKLNIRNIRDEIRIIKDIYNNAWSRNWGFVPMTDAEFEYMAADMKKMVDPDLALVAEIGGNPAGFSLALPDYNVIIKKCNGRLLPFGIFHFIFGKSRINTLRLLTMGVKREHQKRGLDVLFYLHTIKNGFAKGIFSGEFSWILEDNVMMNRIMETLGARVYKKYRIYEKSLAGE